MCCRGWSKRCVDDGEPVSCFAIAGVEAQGLAKEDGGRLMLVASRRELAEQAIGEAALRIESDDIAQVGLRIEIPAQRDVRAGSDQ
ncbi:MAG TPA: hypothetical protein VLX92_32525 [Kofleriaceae bacterium]|nr:hypothetical protein [Kofleriaceae bacterium]